jgi:hypothetical protein
MLFSCNRTLRTGLEFTVCGSATHLRICVGEDGETIRYMALDTPVRHRATFSDGDTGVICTANLGASDPLNRFSPPLAFPAMSPVLPAMQPHFD